MKEKCCGTCLFNSHPNYDEWICDNPNSEVYGLDINYGDFCEDYESKEES